MATRKPLFMQAEGYSEEMAATDDLLLSKLTLSGLAGVSLDGGGMRAANFADPTTGGDLATKTYVDSIAVGIRDFKDSVRAATTAALPAHGFAAGVITASANGALPAQDGVTLVNGNRLLVKNEAGSHLEHGIYVVTDVGSAGTPFILTRSTDADVSAEVTAGMYLFVEEGTTQGDTSWILSTDNPITLNTTALTFVQFASLSNLLANAGLIRSGVNLAVELDTAAGAQTAGADGGSSGLEFDATGAAGKLRAAVHATAGLERTGTGLGVRLNGTTLQSAAAGVSVKGLPSLFEVNAVATGATVTAANLNSLTNDSNADALHDHEDIVMLRVANGAIAKGVGVHYSANDQVSTGDASNDAKSRIVGVADAAILTTATGKIKKSGVVTGVLSGATFNTRYYLGVTTGLPVLIGALAAGSRTIQLGIAKNATDLEVAIVDYGKKAA